MLRGKKKYGKVNKEGICPTVQPSIHSTFIGELVTMIVGDSENDGRRTGRERSHSGKVQHIVA